MDTFLVVRVLDVNYFPLEADAVVTSFDGGAKRPLDRTLDQGVMELQVPPGTSRIEITVTHKGFWPAIQKLRLNAGKLPTLAFDGPQAINVRDLEAHTRGVDSNVVVNVALGQTRDARAKVEAVFARGRVETITPAARLVRDLGETLLAPGGRGWDRLNHVVSQGVAPDGQMFFLERPTVPKLVAVYVPANRFKTFQRDGTSPASVPIPYHVFFHPSTRAFAGAYPFARDYIDMISRYMLRDQDFRGNKAMVNQHVVAGKRPVFVFPVGSPTAGFGGISEQASLLRLLQEVNYILQRMDGIAYPIHPVGFCAVSAFSQGCDALKTMLDTPFSEFDNDHLREIYGLDLFRHKDVSAVCRSLGAWFRGGADKRKLRIYTQDARWRTGIRANTPAGAVTTGPDRATEDESASTTLLFDPVEAFWTGMAREVPKPPPLGKFDAVPGTFFEAHAMHSALFLTHALKLSSFSD
jgi:hypothetical protein